MPFTYQYPRPSLAVDCVVFGFSESAASQPPRLEVLLIRRNEEPFKGRWALPGGHVHVSDTGNQGEDLETAARRELNEETGVQVNYLEQLYTFGDPGRDPRGRVISVAYFALVRSKDHETQAGSDADEARWFPMPVADKDLAFDHPKILDLAFKRLQMKVRYAPLGFNLLPAKFRLSQLQDLYEAVLGRPLDKRNFRKRILAMGILKEAGDDDAVRPGPRAQLYRFDKRAYDLAVKNRFNFEI